MFFKDLLPQQYKECLRKDWLSTLFVAAYRVRTLHDARVDLLRQYSVLQPAADHLVKRLALVETPKTQLDQCGRCAHRVQMHFGQSARQNGVLALVGQEDHHLVGTAEER